MVVSDIKEQEKFLICCFDWKKMLNSVVSGQFNKISLHVALKGNSYLPVPVGLHLIRKSSAGNIY